MRKISLKEAQPGMVLASNVLNFAGQLLLNKGLTLTDDHLQMMKRRDVLLIDIEETASSGIPVASAPTAATSVATKVLLPEQLEQKLKEKFRHADLTYPPMQAIYEATKNHWKPGGQTPHAT